MYTVAIRVPKKVYFILKFQLIGHEFLTYMYMYNVELKYIHGLS